MDTNKPIGIRSTLTLKLLVLIVGGFPAIGAIAGISGKWPVIPAVLWTIVLGAFWFPAFMVAFTNRCAVVLHPNHLEIGSVFKPILHRWSDIQSFVVRKGCLGDGDGGSFQKCVSYVLTDEGKRRFKSTHPFLALFKRASESKGTFDALPMFLEIDPEKLLPMLNAYKDAAKAGTAAG